MSSTSEDGKASTETTFHVCMLYAGFRTASDGAKVMVTGTLTKVDTITICDVDRTEADPQGLAYFASSFSRCVRGVSKEYGESFQVISVSVGRA